jgi:hypothetical protein
MMRSIAHLFKGRVGFASAVVRIAAVLAVGGMLWLNLRAHTEWRRSAETDSPRGHAGDSRAAAAAGGGRGRGNKDAAISSVGGIATARVLSQGGRGVGVGGGGATEAGLSWAYLLGDDARESPFGRLSAMECVCGTCGGDSSQGGRPAGAKAMRGPSSVRCSFVTGAVRVCVLTDALFYAEPKPTVTFASTQIPLVLAVCELDERFKDLFSSRKAGVFWKSHNNFGGVKFDHVSEWRLAHMPPDKTACPTGDATSNASCSVPTELVWQGVRHSSPWGNGWGLHARRAGLTLWSSIPRAPQLGATATVAYMDSADCWAHDFAKLKGSSINPWHCIASALNWNILAALLSRRPDLVGMQSFSPANAVLLALQGYDEYYDNRPLVGCVDRPWPHFQPPFKSLLNQSVGQLLLFSTACNQLLPIPCWAAQASCWLGNNHGQLRHSDGPQ